MGRPKVKFGTIFLCALALAISVFAQSSQQGLPALTPMKQFMLDVVHPAANQILLVVYRGGPADEKEWAAVRYSAAELTDSGALLMVPSRARDQGDSKDVALMANAAKSAYKAAQAKDPKALADAATMIDASCISCHRQYRPDVFHR